MKFEIGDKVKIIKISKDDPDYLLHKTGKVVGINNEREHPYEIKFDNDELFNEALWSEHELDFNKPCEYCNDNSNFLLTTEFPYIGFASEVGDILDEDYFIHIDRGYLRLTTDDYQCLDHGEKIKINYCPMCGRKLHVN